MGELIEFKGEPVSFVETMQVTDGVKCDVYSFVGNPTKDLGIVAVSSECRTPKQRVVGGTRTTEGYIAGRGTLTVWSEDGGASTTYFYGEGSRRQEVVVGIGEIMQWEAAEDSALKVYEICEPPYQEGRFENII